MFDLRRISPSHSSMRRIQIVSFACFLVFCLGIQRSPAADSPDWLPLFDGKTLNGWKPTDFAGHGEIEIVEETLQVNMGAALSGVSYTNATPKVDYEVSLQARKISGGDFFCGLTVPVGETHCTLIVGGWGGGVLGISSIDGQDASENETMSTLYFETGKWFDIRFRIRADRLKVWVDKEKLIDVDIKDRKIEMRAGEIEIAKPFSLSTYSTTAQYRNIRLRKLTAADKE
jgi:hypothetical protein